MLWYLDPITNLSFKFHSLSYCYTYRRQTNETFETKLALQPSKGPVLGVKFGTRNHLSENFSKINLYINQTYDNENGPRLRNGFHFDIGLKYSSQPVVREPVDLWLYSHLLYLFEIINDLSLSSVFDTNSIPTKTSLRFNAKYLYIHSITPNPWQTRVDFASSIKLDFCSLKKLVTSLLG